MIQPRSRVPARLLPLLLTVATPTFAQAPAEPAASPDDPRAPSPRVDAGSEATPSADGQPGVRAMPSAEAAPSAGEQPGVRAAPRAAATPGADGRPAAPPNAAPSSAAPSSVLGEDTVPIDLRAAVELALTHNPELKAASLGVEQAGQTVLAEEGRYPYLFQADAGYTTREIPRLSPDDTVTSSLARSYSVGAALRRLFPTGTVGELRIQGERFERDAVGAGVSGGRSLGEGFGVSARASLTQPLLRGAGTRVGEAELRAARVGRTLSENSQARLLSGLVRDVLVTYWELWFATQSVAIERAALDLAVRQHRAAEQQARLGALAVADIHTFATRVAEIEEAIVMAENQRQQWALELGRLFGRLDDSHRLAAVSDPDPSASPASPAQVEAALRAGSVELAELESQARLARTRAQIAGENARPRLDLESFVESQGVSSGVPGAAQRAGQMSWMTGYVGLAMELPLDDTRRRAERSAALLAVQIAEQNLQAARARIAAQAHRAVNSEHVARERLALAQRTLATATQAYEAERTRFELGQSFPMQVLVAEDNLRRARLRVARAKVDLVQAEAELRHLSGHLLEEYR